MTNVTPHTSLPKLTEDPANTTIALTGFTDISNWRKFKNHLATVLVYFTMVLALVPLIWVLVTLLVKGLPAVLDYRWWIYDMYGQLSDIPGGGVAHAIIGTLTQTVVTTLFSVPIGILTAIYLVEYANGNVLGRITTFMVDILTGVPSIVAALFIYALWITTLGFERSGFAVSLALVLLMIPVVVRNTEEMLRIVPLDLREASYALGVPKWKTILKIVLPTALSGITTGVMLAMARIMGESAPVLILVGGTSIINWNVFSGNQSSLPLFMLDMYKLQADPMVTQRMWGAALTLVLLIGLLNVLARFISKRYAPKY